MNPISLPKSPTNSAGASDEEQLLSDSPRNDIKFLAPFVQVQQGYSGQSGQAKLKAVGLVLMLLSLGGSGVLLGRALDPRPLTGNLLELFCQLLQDGNPNILICNMMNITDALYTPQVALFTSGAAVPVGMVGGALYNYFPLCFPKVVMSPQSKPEEEIPLQIGLEEGGGEPGPPIFKIFLMAMASYASGMVEGVASHLLEIGQNFEKYCPPYNPLNRTNSNSSELLCNITKAPEVVPGVLENARELYLFGGGLPIFILVFSVILYRICCQRK